MKKHLIDTCARFVIVAAVAGLFAAMPAQAAKTAPASAAAGNPALTPEAARVIVSGVKLTPAGGSGQLLSQNALRKFNAALRKNIQQALLEIYAGDPAYMQAYREIAAPLSDNIVGPITLSWLNRFWLDFKLEPVGNLTDASVRALLGFAAIVKAHPEWKSDLLSADLGRWIDSQDAADKARYYQIRLAGTDEQIRAMLKLYHYDTDNSRSTVNPDRDQALLKIFMYSLTADDLKLLQAKSQIVEKLSVLQDTTFANKVLFDNAITDALKTMGEQVKGYLPMIEKYAHETSYKLSPRSVQALRADKQVPDAILAAIQDLNDVYPDKDAFVEALTTATAGIADSHIERYVPLIIEVSEVDTSYTLSEAALDEMKADPANAAVPPVVIELLKSLQGLEYPQQSLFDSAVTARLRMALGACPNGLVNNVVDRRKLSAEAMQQLKESVGTALFEQLNKFWNGDSCSADDLIVMHQQIDALYLLYRSSLRDSARKRPLYDPSSRVLWDGNSCGCSEDQFVGEVYGFYPFWLAGKPQQINFSSLTRIGYYGITFDDNGSLRQANDGRDINAALLNGDPAQTAFVSVAHRYRTKVDWVIQRNDWRSWSKLGKDRKEQIFDQLAASISQMLAARLNDGMAAQVLPYLPFGARAIPTNGDGVTLYFDDYPADASSVAVFAAFVQKLESGLRNAGVGHAVNILMRHSAMGKGIYDYKNLLALIDASNGAAGKGGLAGLSKDPDIWPRYLVFIEEETTDSKKQLRLQVEAALHGADRERVLRQIVPVLTFDQQNWQQLEDDIIYSKDNFGGIGFWPLAFTSAAAGGAGAAPAPPAAPVAPVATAGVQRCEVTKDINQCLVDQYQVNPGAEASQVCKFVCENRWAFRLSWDLCFLLLLGFSGLYYWSCRWRELMHKYYCAPLLVTGAGAFFISIALLFCDPFLQRLTSGYLIPLFLLLVIVILIAVYQYQLKARDEQP